MRATSTRKAPLVLLLAGLVALGIVAAVVIWIPTIGPRMKQQLDQCTVQQTDALVVGCMSSHGWTFNRQLLSCDNGSASDVGCYETGLPWP